MAHSWRAGRRPLAVLLGAGLASFAPESGAIALGDAQVRSALGENLDVRIPVTMERGESIEPACFTLARAAESAVPRLDAARISLERSAQGAMLRIRSNTAVTEPALALAIKASCPGQASEYQRDYSVLLDPRPVAAAAPGATVTPLSIAATLVARIGDTLESIANAIFPRNQSAKKSYIEALRASNPPLAALGDSEPIPIDTPIALPDLRTFARARVPTQVAEGPRTEPAAPRAPPARRASAPPAAPRVAAAPRERPVAPPASEPRVRAERAAAPVVLPPHRTARGKVAEGYQLKLSSGEVDLTRSRAMDDRSRAQLRDRQLVLDADDQVAAVLALRNSVKQLETRVAELQLKLAGMPASFPPPRAEPPAPIKAPEPPKAAKVEKAPPPVVAAPKQAVVEPPKPVVVEPPKPVIVEPPKQAIVEPPKPVVAEPPRQAAVEPPKPAVVEAPKPVPVEPPPVVAVAPPAPSPPPTSAATEPPAKPAATSTAKMPEPPGTTDAYWLWGLLALVVATLVILVWRLRRRSGEAEMYEEEEEEADEPIVVADEFERQEPVLAEESVAEEFERRSMTSDASLATRLPEEGGTDELRRRYIEERFPEILNRTIVLDDADSVVKGARLFYEDGALARAIELLHFAVERRPEDVKPWLALFEIFRLERLSGQFADLAFRFKEEHGKGDYWRKVQFFGREIDPGNTLYQDESFKSFETIGPSEARRIKEEANFDPVAENWLNAPMDFENEVLANELRKALMAQAAINEQDLVPNPMPALRNVEMFTVA